MRYITEFRSRRLINIISKKIFKVMPNSEISIMEVCGTHTQAFYRFALNKLVPDNLHLIAGPGCPVCVCDQDYVDKAIQLSKDRKTIILTFGDMLRVPGSNTSLEKQRARGTDVRVIYSAWDGIRIAKENLNKRVVLLAVGFETTAPTFALTLKAAQKEKINNLFFFSSLKLIPPAMKALVSVRQINIDGFLCPGHVSTIIGSLAYDFIPRIYKVPCCVAGFEPLDVLEGIYLLLYQIINKKPRVMNQYMRAVKRDGNKKAQAIIKDVFRIVDDKWRGLGEIPRSGLKIRCEFLKFDAERFLSFKHRNWRNPESNNPNRCRCGEVLRGIIRPDECPLFRKVCSPVNPYGPCMVSNEGACNVYYRYK